MKSPSFFNNVKVEIYESVSTGEFDRRGEVVEELFLRCVVDGDLQAVSAKDSLEQYGEILQDTFKLYLDADTIIDNTDVLRIGEDTYTIMGSVQEWNHILPFKKVLLQKDRKVRV